MKKGLSNRKEKPLIEFQTGATVKIISIHSEPKTKAKLASLGLSIASEIKIVTNRRWMPLIIEICHSNFALERREASKIIGISSGT